MPRSFASPMSYLALMQEAARACPASAPCPDHDARTRVCAGAENRTRNALNATLTTLKLLVGRCAASQGSAGLASCYSPRSLRQADRRGFALGQEIRPQQGPAARLADNYNTTIRVNR